MKNRIDARIIHLFQRPQHVPTVACWIYNEFWAGKNRYSADDLATLLRQAKRTDTVPQSLLALCSEEPVGTVNLIAHDDDNRPDLTPWLAALYVRPEFRGRGIGSLLVRTLQRTAARLGIRSLYLGTDNPGFYARLGATIYEHCSADFAIMVLSASGIAPNPTG
jgi:predicted N-acetyltransferase YhbS